MNLKKKKKETEKRKICDLDGMVLVDMFFVAAVPSWWRHKPQDICPNMWKIDDNP